LVLSPGFGASADCTAAIALPNVPDKLVAQALYCRGVVKKDHGDTDGAVVDYSAAIAMSIASPEVVEFARECLTREQRSC
jgi:hypothetical protein